MPGLAALAPERGGSVQLRCDSAAVGSSGRANDRPGFQSAIQDLIPRFETCQGFCGSWGCHLRSGADLPQVAQPSGGLPPVIRPARISRAPEQTSRPRQSRIEVSAPYRAAISAELADRLRVKHLFLATFAVRRSC
jgi:hypothetical protein